MRTIEDMVQQEVNCCLSSMVSTLANSGLAYRPSHEFGPDACDLAEQALELASPVDDCEEAAIQAGWLVSRQNGSNTWVAKDQSEETGYPDIEYDSAEELCADEGIEPYEREVFEHWAVSTWLAEKLIAQGEKVDFDFAGLCVWARTTTGQSISADGVIERIYSNMMKGV